MIPVGATFLTPTPSCDTEHLYIIIAIEDKKALFVNITTKKEKSDCSCVLNKGDHSFIKWPSVINYAEAKECDISKIERALQSKIFKAHKPVSPELLERIINGAKISQSLPSNLLKYFE
ncbi:MAG: hypothetical protein HY955_03825 [Deltaproteobacteria bacterium]|nr:hypothetical protein [Deltaproteobacteria bacterium]